MAQYDNQSNKVSFAFESGAYGTIHTSGQWIGLVQSNDLEETEGIEMVRYTGQNNRDVGQYIPTVRDVKGVLTYYPQDWKFLAFTLGANVSAGSPSPYSHTITEARNLTGNPMTSGAIFPSFQIEDAKQYNPTGLNFVRQAQGCVVDSFDMSWDQGGIIENKINYIAQTVIFTSGATTTVTASTLRPFVWSDVLLSMPSGTTVNTLKSGTLSIKNNANAPHYCNGSRDIATVQMLNSDKTLEITADMDTANANTYYGYYKSGTAFNSVMTVNAADAGTGSRTLAISMSGCTFTKMTTPTKLEGIQEISMTVDIPTVSAVVADLIEKYWWL